MGLRRWGRRGGVYFEVVWTVPLEGLWFVSYREFRLVSGMLTPSVASPLAGAFFRGILFWC